jgi:hypothetical protein
VVVAAGLGSVQAPVEMAAPVALAEVAVAAVVA